MIMDVREVFVGAVYEKCNFLEAISFPPILVL